MATIKSYTNLKQSKKLAEILPIESADMHYPLPCSESDIPVFCKGGFGSTPCWSLTALLNAIPSSTLDSSDSHHYRIRCNERYSEWYDNSIDTCVAMILKLHESNLL